MNLKRISTVTLASLIISGSVTVSNVFADAVEGAGELKPVLGLAADLNDAQDAQLLQYLNISTDDVKVFEVNNEDEKRLLGGKLPASVIGDKTYSSVLIQPTEPGSGLNIKTVGLTHVTSAQLASALSTSGIVDADVIASCIAMKVSGTGALTGAMMAYSEATGQEIDDTRQELATDELLTTDELAKENEISVDKATLVIGEIKNDIIKNNTQDTTQIAETINNVTNNYNITLSDTQQEKVQGLMERYAQEEYTDEERKGIENALKDINKTLDKKLSELGEIQKGFFSKVGDFFVSMKDNFVGMFDKKNEDSILANTNDTKLASGITIDSTDSETMDDVVTDENGQILRGEEAQAFLENGMNWFQKLIHNIGEWFSNLFGGNKETVEEETLGGTEVMTEESNPTDCVPGAEAGMEPGMQQEIETGVEEEVNTTTPEQQENNLDNITPEQQEEMHNGAGADLK